MLWHETKKKDHRTTNEIKTTTTTTKIRSPDDMSTQINVAENRSAAWK